MSDEGSRAAHAAAEMSRRWHRHAAGAWAAPGRVNLIGEHTDYNDGWVLPLAIGREAVVAMAPRADGVVRVWSTDMQEERSVALVNLPGAAKGWVGYVAGVVWALQQLHDSVRGADVVIDSDVPPGAGLASSAAIECAVALGVAELAALGADRMALALAARRAEQEVVGAPVGVMDQAVSMLARRGAALLLDCRSLSHEHVPLQLDERAATLLVVDTGVRHAHASGDYGRRRAECSQAAQLLGAASLRDVGVDDLDRLDEPLRRRARHVVTDNMRVLDVVAALHAGDLAGVGPLLLQSHASLRDDFEVSVPELDVAVEAATRAGAWGARMTGGGFGGSVIALVPHDAVAAVHEEVNRRHTECGFAPPTIYAVAASDGAHRVGIDD